jgi:hypothetical protein
MSFKERLERKQVAELLQTDKPLGTEKLKYRSYAEKPDLDSSFTERVAEHYEDVELGCDEFLTIIANQEVVRVWKSAIVVNGRVVRIRYAYQETFGVFLDKITSRVKLNPIGKWSVMQDPQESAFLLLVCREKPFALSSYFLIRNPPIPKQRWILSAGLVSFVEGQGYGKRMLTAVEELGRTFGVRSIVIESTPASFDYYIRNGYKNIDGKDVEKIIGIVE